MAHGWYSSIMHGDACSPLHESSRASTDSTTNNIFSMFHHFIQLTFIMSFRSTSACLTSRLGSPAEALIMCMPMLKTARCVLVSRKNQRAQHNSLCLDLDTARRFIHPSTEELQLHEVFARSKAVELQRVCCQPSMCWITSSILQCK
jgi:hypothetical protein